MTHSDWCWLIYHNFDISRKGKLWTWLARLLNLLIYEYLLSPVLHPASSSLNPINPCSPLSLPQSYWHTKILWRRGKDKARTLNKQISQPLDCKYGSIISVVLCVQNSSKCFTYICSFNFHKTTLWGSFFYILYVFTINVKTPCYYYNYL